MSLKPEDCNSNLDDLDQSKIKILDDWQKVHSFTIGTCSGMLPSQSLKASLYILHASLCISGPTFHSHVLHLAFLRVTLHDSCLC